MCFLVTIPALCAKRIRYFCDLSEEKYTTPVHSFPTLLSWDRGLDGIIQDSRTGDTWLYPINWLLNSDSWCCTWIVKWTNKQISKTVWSMTQKSLWRERLSAVNQVLLSLRKSATPKRFIHLFKVSSLWVRNQGPVSCLEGLSLLWVDLPKTSQWPER